MKIYNMKKFFNDLIKNLTLEIKDDGFNAQIMNLKSKYGLSATSREEVVKRTIDSIKRQIKNKIEISEEEKLLVLVVSPDKKDLYEEVRKYFEEKEFKTFYAGKEQIPELGEREYLFISWDL